LQLLIPVPMARKNPKTRPPPTVFLKAKPTFYAAGTNEDQIG
jgi:hypothetical protein